MENNPYLLRKNKHKIGKAGRRSENLVAKKLNARSQPGSGNVKGAKGDIRKDNILIECKATEAESFSLTREILAKISGEALAQNRTPALSISFVTGNGRPKENGEWVAVPMKEFQEYLEFKKKTEDEIND